MPDGEIRDPEVERLASIASFLEGFYADADDFWRDSPFDWIRNRPSRQRGKIGEQLVAGWCEEKGFEVARSPDSEADLVIAGVRVEVKYSSLWTQGRGYRFQQIRDQNYDFCFCLGVSPFDAHAWFVPKHELMIDKPPELVPQHGGREGRDTKWLSFRADQPPDWLGPYGGDLASVCEVIREWENPLGRG